MHYFSKRLLGVLTLSTEVASNTDLGSEEEGVLPIAKTLLNLGNSLDSLNSPFSKIIILLIALVGFQGVEP